MAKKNNSGSNKNNGFLQADNLVKQDLGKKTNYHLPDAKGHNEFLKLTEMNKNPTGREVEMKLYTLDDVKQHNRSNDAWIVINGKVYDITRYIPYHPGGNKILMGVGKDGTSLYNKYHPWVNANYLLEKYQIGFLKK